MSNRSPKKHKSGHYNPPAKQLSQQQDQTGGISQVDPARLLPLIHHEIQSVVSSWSGPLPPPAALREFNEIIPQGADRILKMAEAQEAHRHGLENRALDSEILRSHQGLYCAVLIAFLFACVATYALYLGNPIQAAIIAGVPSASMLGVFIYGHNSRRKEREGKANAMSAASNRSAQGKLSATTIAK